MSCNNTIRERCRRALRSGPHLRRDCSGSAIVLVVSVGALVTLMVFTWVAFSVRRYHAVIDKRDELRARYAAESVISKAVLARRQNPSGRLRPDSVVIVRQGDSAMSVTMDSSCVYEDSGHASSADADIAEEGSFLRVTASGRSGKASCEISALFGTGLPLQFKYALILNSQNAKPLEIRKGRIIGDVQVAVPPQGSVQGAVESGVRLFPTVAEEKFEEEISRFNGKIQFPEKAEIVLQGNQAFDERRRPPLEKEKDLFINGHCLCENGSRTPLLLKGPAAIIVTGDLQISGSVEIENMELLALGQVKCFGSVRLRKVKVYSQSSIYLGDNVRCCGNLYAYQNVTLAGQATVDQPAFVYVRGVVAKDPSARASGLQLVEEACMTGIFFGKDASSTSLIERGTRFTGLLYTRGHVILEGTVFGCVAAHSLKESMESDRNILAGGTINQKVLPRNFTVPLAFAQPGATFSLVEWDEKMKNAKEDNAK